ncbi:unnamed protein product [Protopolystoma xenopodis]|uniref:Uncharacterized protein n=1 Tax=Protopolystoma xenopodis TaxID=117903 RepID=A0A448XKB0_9PLAT|nr:unnamed protein product [Protopolystoma xenopodis]
MMAATATVCGLTECFDVMQSAPTRLPQKGLQVGRFSITLSAACPV